MAPMIFSATPRARLWDPYKVLNVHPEDYGFTCVGVAPTRGYARCGWRIPEVCEAACDRLDAMATCEPSEIKREVLALLARQCLCTEWHQNQATKIVRDWQDKIDAYVRECKKAAPPEEKNDHLKLALQESLEGEKRLGQRVLEQEIKFHDVKAANSSLQQQLKGVEANFKKIKSSNAQEIDKLKEQLQESNMRLEEATVTKVVRLREIDKLKGKLEDRNNLLEETRTRTSSEIDKLKKRIEEGDKALQEQQKKSSEEIASLQQEVKEGDDKLKTLKTASPKEKEQLVQEVKERDDKLETLKTASSKEKEQLVQEVKKRDERFETFRTASSKEREQLVQEVEGMKKQHDDSKRKSNARLSKLQQQNQTLKVQKNCKAFVAQVQLFVKQRRLESAESANAALSDQAERLVEQMGILDRQVADQSRMLSLVKLQNVKRGICAVVAARPPTFSVRRIPKISNGT